jgi:hypothetical protein
MCSISCNKQSFFNFGATRKPKKVQTVGLATNMLGDLVWTLIKALDVIKKSIGSDGLMSIDIALSLIPMMLFLMGTMAGLMASEPAPAHSRKIAAKNLASWTMSFLYIFARMMWDLGFIIKAKRKGEYDSLEGIGTDGFIKQGTLIFVDFVFLMAAHYKHSIQEFWEHRLPTEGDMHQPLLNSAADEKRASPNLEEKGSTADSIGTAIVPPANIAPS